MPAQCDRGTTTVAFLQEYSKALGETERSPPPMTRKSSAKRTGNQVLESASPKSQSQSQPVPPRSPSKKNIKGSEYLFGLKPQKIMRQ